jgi:hypothetical protein
MRLLWPPEYMLPRQVVLVATHLCFTAMAALFLLRITRRPWLVLMTLWLFAGARPGNLTPVCDLLLDPKNVPDALAGTAVLASLYLLVSGRWKTGLAAAAVSVGFKEIGFVTWPLALVTLVWLHRDRFPASDRRRQLAAAIRRNRMPIAAWASALGLLLAVHFLAVGVGYQLGANRYWLLRMTTFLGGPLVVTLNSTDKAFGVTALGVVAVVIGFRQAPLLARFIGILSAIVLGALVDAHVMRVTFDVSLTRMVILWPYGPYYCTAWLLVAWQARKDWQTALFGLAMSFVAALPTWMGAQILDHARYLAYLFLELVVAVALCRTAGTIAQYALSRKDRSHGSAIAE